MPESDSFRCLDEDDVLAFVTGRLESSRRSEILAHIDACEACRETVAEVAREQMPEDEPLPPPAVTDLFSDVLVDGRFRLLGVLGRGAMGTVHRARDEELGIDVALKIVSGSPKAFARELIAGRRVTHQNVCRLHDAGQHEGTPYITMELVEGESLAEVLAQGELSVGRAHEILDGIAAGLAAAHERGIVHRDLKPENVMIERVTGRPVLTDFGFAADLQTKESRKLVGTPAYWAPEQARGEPPTPASDVYSLGLLGYRLLARRDFSLSDADTLRALPRQYRAFVSKCLAARPRDRFCDAGEARERLRATTRTAGQRWLLLAPVLLLAPAVWAMARGNRPSAESSPSEPTTAATMASSEPAERPPEPHTTETGLVSSPSSPSVAMSAASAPISARTRATSTAVRHPPNMAGTIRSPSRMGAVSANPTASEGDPLFRH